MNTHLNNYYLFIYYLIEYIGEKLTGQQKTARTNWSSSAGMGAPPVPINRMRPPNRFRILENISLSHIVLCL